MLPHCVSSPSFAHLVPAQSSISATPASSAIGGRQGQLTEAGRVVLSTVYADVVRADHPAMSLIADVGGTLLAARSSKGMVITCDVDEGRLEIRSQASHGPGISSLKIGQAI